MLSKDQQQEILQKFDKILPGYHCPVCGNDSYKFMNGYVMMPLQPRSDNYSLRTGEALACIAVICDRCGYVSLHSTQTLGLTLTTN